MKSLIDIYAKVINCVRRAGKSSIVTLSRGRAPAEANMTIIEHLKGRVFPAKCT